MLEIAGGYVKKGLKINSNKSLLAAKKRQERVLGTIKVTLS